MILLGQSKQIVVVNTRIIGAYANAHVDGDVVIADGVRLPITALGGGFQIVDAIIPPGFIPDNFIYVDGEIIASPITATALKQLQDQKSAQIDTLILAVYDKPNTLARVYLQREAQALSFKNAGYIGEPGNFLASFAERSGMLLPAATDKVLAQALAFRTYEPELEDLRMRKYEIARMVTAGEIESIFAQVYMRVLEIVALLQ